MPDEEERKGLLRLARRSVRAAAEGSPPPEPPEGGIYGREGGAFVTLHKRDELRGCIGHFTGEGGIGRTVVKMAAAAAVQDPRFPPVRPDELENIDIEISILSKMVPAKPEEVQPGKHGVYVRYGPFSGTLLPQVATEQGWDRETFLDHSCLKAGLDPGAWRDGRADIMIYTAEVFGEKDFQEKEDVE
ncbi:AmmeMemoRadiSam system protein A [Candidatus Fermentibacteria bacterium]|nr:AmmeMemoRadiSam system protein A [Candidatus Fermentibacteria bacterium]